MQGEFCPSNVVDLMNKLLSGSVIHAVEFQTISNNLLDDHNPNTDSGTPQGDELVKKVLHVFLFIIYLFIYFCELPLILNFEKD